MNQRSSHIQTPASQSHGFAEAGLFLAAAALVACSAIVVKESREAPALVAVDTSGQSILAAAFPAPAQPFIAPTAERRTATAEAIDNASAPAVAPEDAGSSHEAGALRSAHTVPATAQPHTDDDVAVRYFDGRPIRPVRTIWMTVTAYSPDARSCGDSADGITASLKSVWTNGMKLVAADTRLLPFGSLITVPGYDEGRVVPVLDRGGAIKGRRLDVLYPTHEIALKWGVRKLPITVWEYADGKDGRSR